MPLTLTFTAGYTFVPHERVTAAKLNLLGAPSFSLTGTAGSSDIADSSITASKLNPEVLNGLTAETALATGDVFGFYDLSAADNRKITVANMLNGLFSLAPAGTAFTDYSADLVTVSSGGSAAAMTAARFAEQLIAQAPALTTTVDADEVLVHDASADDGSQATRVTLANLLPDKVTAGAYNGLLGIDLDAKGRVTGVRYAGASSVAMASVVDSGSAPYTPQAITAGSEQTIRLTSATSVAWLSLNSNAMTLSAGTYAIDACVPLRSPSSSVGRATLILRGASSGVLAAATMAASGQEDGMYMHLRRVFTLAAQEAVELKAYVETNSDVGISYTAPGVDEVYTQILMTKLA